MCIYNLRVLNLIFFYLFLLQVYYGDDVFIKIATYILARGFEGKWKLNWYNEEEELIGAASVQVE